MFSSLLPYRNLKNKKNEKYTYFLIELRLQKNNIIYIKKIKLYENTKQPKHIKINIIYQLYEQKIND